MFSLGKPFITCGIQSLIEEEKLKHENILDMITKHSFNISDVCLDDLKYNKECIDNGYGRVFSMYHHNGYKFYVITDNHYIPSEAITTVLLADEY